MSLTQSQMMAAIAALADSSANNTQSIQETTVSTKIKLENMAIIAVIPDDEGNLVRASKVTPGFEDIQSNYITIELGATVGLRIKTYKRAIFESQAPDLFALLEEKIDGMEANGGVWEPIAWTSELSIQEIVFKRDFTIPDNKGGWSKDKKGNIVRHNVKEILFMPAIDNIQTIVRREIRNLEYSGAFGAVVAPQGDANAQAPAAQAPAAQAPAAKAA